MTEDTQEIHPMLHPRARSLLILPLLLCAVLAGCSGSSEPATTPVPAVTSSAAPSQEEEATAAFQQYWDAYVQISNSGDVDPGLYAGVADGPFVELDLKLLRDQSEAGVLRVGEPTFGEYSTTVDGATATSKVCYDESGWGATSDGKDVADYGAESIPGTMTATLENRSGAWIVTDLKFKEDKGCQ